jgi:hypothetical protein
MWLPLPADSKHGRQPVYLLIKMRQLLFNRRRPGQLTSAAIIACWLVASALIAQDKASDGFKPLFPNEGVPSGWLVRSWDDVSKPVDDPPMWKVSNGVLIGGEPRGTWLMSEREYGDFELEFEFKLGPRGNSGLALRAPLAGDPAFDGIELQMADKRYNPDAKDSELTGGLYRAVAPRKQVYKPTEWNRYEIKLQGSKLRVVLNGELIHDLDLDKENSIVKRHDGTDAPPIKDRPRRGHIGFQNLSRGEDDVLIRNARIKVPD